ncbi:hypothetical protein ASPZODRAFT_144951 [Penicilliopsis zonata CBS 506.65]|uniref:Uncharacterized protein n=1 Tax=Penicilliopsis zonata CBS 506.65 TaxID=1073090 RepID=A0A1L9SB24_9EURO|nr:hypothetical protein ASPZODRAFT_144951 [Penicilliopsis zonata CBS 506.65]OJJ44380.1 hypothetical protein ASPZODRAFT_144951 [Penicilliopsis zonata CBS 506.65]
MSITVLATSTRERHAREPLRAIDMAASQARPAPSSGAGRGRGRRPKAPPVPVQEEEEEAATAAAEEQNGENLPNEMKKRKAVFDEDIEGFQFSRKPSKKPKSTTIDAMSEISESVEHSSPPKRGRPKKNTAKGQENATGSHITAAVPTEPATTTTITTTAAATKRTRRTSQIVAEAAPETSIASTPRSLRAGRGPPPPPVESLPPEKKRKRGRPSKSNVEETNGYISPEPEPSGTSKIALPLADTPVIQRNKEMRGTKSGKQRRSSLGMRGRRASSLIDSGASNGGNPFPQEQQTHPILLPIADISVLVALPHKAVGTAEFYKHIAADLPEPRRMRQLLIWCATRAMGDKPSGSRSEDESARLAARVIQEELLKDFANNSELSNWFAREDVAPPAVVVKKPNPKNIQNTDKIKELEEQIQRLQRERHALNALLRLPPIPSIQPPPPPSTEAPTNGQQKSPTAEPSEVSNQEEVNPSLLDPSQQAILALFQGKQEQEPTTSPDLSLPPFPPSAISSRLSRLTSSLAPTFDSFAAGIHDIELYRTTADSVSSRILRVCAERLDERDARNALRSLVLDDHDGDSSTDIQPRPDTAAARAVQRRRPRPREDLGLILGALSRVERR